jgi:uncharacterized protein (TIGR03382 family)
MNGARASEPPTAAPPRPRLIGPLISLWLVTIIMGGLVGGYALPRCAENLPPGVILAAVLSAMIAGWLGWRRRMKSWWVLLLALIYGGLAWITIALAIAIGNILASGLCRLF